MNEKLLVRVIERLSQHFQPAAGELIHHEVLFREKLIFSEVVRLRLSFDASALVVFLKKYADSDAPDSARSVELEYQTLACLYDRFTSSGRHLNVIKPIMMFPEDHLLITEDFGGEKLQRVILSELRWGPSSSRIDRVESLLASSGQWLRQFQTLTSEGNHISVDHAFYLRAINGHLRRCTEHGMSRELADRIIRFADDSFKQGRAYRLPLVGFHHDFTTWNILAGEQGLAVMDFDRFDYRHQYDDLSNLLVVLEEEKSVLGMRSSHVERLKRAFLDGYGSEDLDQDLLTLFTLKNAVKELGVYGGARLANTRLFDRTYERFRIGRRTTILLNHINAILGMATGPQKGSES